MVISKGVAVIGNCAFYSCTGLREVVIPEGVKTIDSGAFYNCLSLDIVHLPVGVSEIDNSVYHAFGGCDYLEAIYVPKNNVDFYKERFPDYMHWLIVEEGSDLPVWHDNEYDEEHYDVYDIMYDIMYDEVYKEDENA